MRVAVRAVRLALCLLLALSGFCLSASDALAHANLVVSDPLAGADLQQPPPVLELFFSEPVDPAQVTVALFDASGQRVATAPARADSDRSVALTVPPLQRGGYVAAWRVQSSVDGHVTSGSVPFSVGGAAAPAVSGAGNAPPASPLEVLLRWLQLASLLLLTGMSSFRTLRPGALGRHDRWPLLLGLMGLAASAGLLLLSAVIAPAAAMTVLTSRFAWLLAGRGLLALLSGWLLRGAGRARSTLALIAGAGALYLMSLTSHSAAAGSLSGLSVSIDLAHLLGASIWVGGVAELLRRRMTGALDPGDVRWFARPALAAATTVGLTGLYEAWLHVGSWPALINTTYGLVASAKGVLWVVAAALGLMTARSIPRRAGGSALRVEAAAFALIILMAAVLSSLGPPRQVQSGAARPLAVSGDAGATAVHLSILPARPGPNSYQVQLAGPHPDQVLLRLTFLGADFGTSETELSPSGNEFSARDSSLSVAGPWQAQVTLVRSGTPDIGTVFRFDVTPTGALPPEPQLIPLQQYLWALPVVLLALLGGLLLVLGLLAPTARAAGGYLQLAVGSALLLVALVVWAGAAFAAVGPLAGASGLGDHNHGVDLSVSGPGLTLADRFGPDEVLLRTSPAQSGPDRFSVTVLDAHGGPVNGLNLSLAVGPGRGAVLASEGPGRYGTDGSLPWDEPWTIAVTEAGTPGRSATFTFVNPTDGRSRLSAVDLAMNSHPPAGVAGRFDYSSGASDIYALDRELVAGTPCRVLSFIDASGVRVRLWAGLDDNLVYQEKIDAPGSDRWIRFTY
ncbi:MAG: copper resistance CopC/CopD family protein [Candidatus Dormibacteria bacterium]